MFICLFFNYYFFFTSYKKIIDKNQNQNYQEQQFTLIKDLHLNDYELLPKGHSHKIKDLDQLKKYLAENKDVTVQKVIEKFGDMRKETVYNYFKKINYTYKKTFLYEQRDKNKQEDLLKEIAKIMNEDLVNIDESRIDDNEFINMVDLKKAKDYFIINLHIK